MNVLAAAAAAKHSEVADRAAAIGAIRGELWAEAAFTHAQSLWGSAASGTSVRESVQRAREELGRAVRYAPHRSDAWLMLADLAQRFASSEFDPTEAFRMSYYTGSNEIHLVPVRLMTVMKRDYFDDAELRELIRHDIRLLLGLKQLAPISAAYLEASVKGKDFLVRAVKDIDPAAAETLQGGAKRQNTPVAD
jgi:hypothetical protein